jgi:transposase
MSVKQSKKYTGKQKAKMVLEALKNERTIAEIASEYETHPKNIQNWRRQFLENMDVVFEQDQHLTQHKKKLREQQDTIDNLHRQNGKMNTQLEWAKKKVEELELGY